MLRDVSCQDVAKQLATATVVKADEGMVGDPDDVRRLFHFVVRVRSLVVIFFDRAERRPAA